MTKKNVLTRNLILIPIFLMVIGAVFNVDPILATTYEYTNEIDRFLPKYEDTNWENDPPSDCQVFVDTDARIQVYSDSDGTHKILKYVYLDFDCQDMGSRMYYYVTKWINMGVITSIETKIEIKRDSTTIHNSGWVNWPFSYYDSNGNLRDINDFSFPSNWWPTDGERYTGTAGYDPDISFSNGQKLYIYAQVRMKGYYSAQETVGYCTEFGYHRPSGYDGYFPVFNHQWTLSSNVESSGGGGGGCPILYVNDGSEYISEGLLDIHENGNENDIIYEQSILTMPGRINGRYLMKLIEHPQTISHIDQIKVFATLKTGMKIVLPLVSAYHSEEGNVLIKLLFSDDCRIDCYGADWNNGISQAVYLEFLALHHNQIESLSFYIEGYNPIGKT